MIRPSIPNRRIASASHSVDAPLPHSTTSDGRSVTTRSTSTTSRSGDAAQPRVAGSSSLAGSTALRFCSASSWRNVCSIFFPTFFSTSAPARRTMSRVPLVSADRFPIRLARSRLCLSSSSRPPSSGPSAISATVGTAPAPVASPSPSAPASHAVTRTATVPMRTNCRISRRNAHSLILRRSRGPPASCETAITLLGCAPAASKAERDSGVRLPSPPAGLGAVRPAEGRVDRSWPRSEEFSGRPGQSASRCVLPVSRFNPASNGDGVCVRK